MGRELRKSVEIRKRRERRERGRVIERRKTEEEKEKDVHRLLQSPSISTHM